MQCAQRQISARFGASSILPYQSCAVERVVYPLPFMPEQTPVNYNWLHTLFCTSNQKAVTRHGCAPFKQYDMFSL